MSNAAEKPALGMKWYAFYVKVRPWFGLAIFLLSSKTFKDTYIPLMDKDLVGLSIAIPTIIYVWSQIIYTLVCLGMAIHSYNNAGESLFGTIKGLLIFEIFYLPFGTVLAQYYAGQSIGSCIVIQLLMMALCYFVWYKPNIKYFRRRFLPKELNDTATVSAPEEVKADSSSIAELPESIAETTLPVETASIEPVCKRCGKTLIQDAVFCLYCGEKVEPEEEKPLICEECGRELIQEAKFCPYCGHPVGSESIVAKALEETQQIQTDMLQKGKKRKSKRKLAIAVVAILAIPVIIAAYLGPKYIPIINAVNDQEFIKAKQLFDETLIGRYLFPDNYAYVKAGVLMEEGEYIMALDAFNNLKEGQAPASITDSLKETIYSKGQSAYRNDDFTTAGEFFTALDGYKRSKDYISLIVIKKTGGLSEEIYQELLRLIDFEDVADLIMTKENTARNFLKGRWVTRGNGEPYYFELKTNSVGKLVPRFNLPWKDNLSHFNAEFEGQYYINNSIYFEGESKATAEKVLKFEIINENIISVYCYKDGSTHKLYRQ